MSDLTPEERAAKREAAVQGMVDKGYTRERAEELLSDMGRVLFGPGGRFATASPNPESETR